MEIKPHHARQQRQQQELFMKTSDSLINIMPALVKMQASASKVRKGSEKKEGAGGTYKYATLEDYIEVVQEGMTENGLFVSTEISCTNRLPDRVTKTGTIQYCVEVFLTIRILHVSGEWIEGAGYGEGQDFGDKAAYKAITGARKYALACLLGLVTTDDPEHDSTIQHSTTQAQRSQNVTKKSATPLPAETLAKFDIKTDELIESLMEQKNEESLRTEFSRVWTFMTKHNPRFTDTHLKKVKDCYDCLKEKPAAYESSNLDAHIENDMYRDR
jgi:hypothetical protein